ncbi:hypothetical protein MD484_g940, partial [Candolleomyces efflorescens]
MSAQLEKCLRRPSVRLTDPDNTEDLELRSHQSAPESGSHATSPATSTCTSTCNGSVTCEDNNNNDGQLSSATNSGAPQRKKRQTEKATASASTTSTSMSGAADDAIDVDGTSMPSALATPSAPNTSDDELLPFVSDSSDEEEEITIPRKKNIKWCKRNNFESNLPSNVKTRKEKTASDQTTLDGHIVAIKPTPPMVKYLDVLFRQPLQCVGHPKFHKLIDIASRATDGVKIPTCQATQESIIKRFKKNIKDLTNRFNSAAVQGHWVEEVSPTNWHLRSALLGFVQMNTAHDGALLGCSLYKIVKRYHIQHKIGHIICDNASNNTTMLKAFEVKLNSSRHHLEARVECWNYRTCHIHCLAHIINLATQVLITTYSKTSHINTESTAADVDSALDNLSNVSLHVDALIKDLQAKNDVKIPLALILDMKVQWSSTFAMLKQAYNLCEYINDFVFKIAQEELSADKARVLRELCVTEEEWTQINKVLKILKHTDEAQHAVSSETELALFHTLPALEHLHKTWTSMAEKPKYFYYHTTINNALAKINTYYNKTSLVNAYNMSMTPTNTTSQNHPIPVAASHSQLDIECSDDKSNSTLTSLAPATTKKLWLREFKCYFDGNDKLDNGQSIVTWWGLNACHLPTWASLACNYLAIMASSVSSEYAFLAAGITISKRHGSLQADIVEALQCLKSLINSALIFHEQDTTADWEFENKVSVEDNDPEWVDMNDESGGEDVV